jgi:hypothetical protein
MPNFDFKSFLFCFKSGSILKPFSQGIHRYFICIFLIIFGCPNGFANKENKKKEMQKKRNGRPNWADPAS